MLAPTWVWGNSVLSRIVSSLRQDHPKYTAVLVVALVAVGWVYQDFHNKVHTEELVSKSLLGQSAWLVHRDAAKFSQGPKRTGPKSPNVLPQERQAYEPPESKIIITPKDPQKTLDQVINVKIIDTWGFTLEPGLDLEGIGPGVGLDFKFFYVGKVGAEVGFEKYFGYFDSFSPTVGLSYRLDRYRMLANTEIKLDYAPVGKIPVSGGIRINF